jgi:hypothetical protein
VRVATHEDVAVELPLHGACTHVGTCARACARVCVCACVHGGSMGGR